MTDEGVSFATAFDIYDSMDPNSFDDDGTETPSDLTDDPCAAGSTSRLPVACAAHGVGSECDRQRDNGQDH